MNRYSLTRITKGEKGGGVFQPAEYLDETYVMFAALCKAASVAEREKCDVEFRCWNPHLGRWEYLALFYPDRSALNTFGDRQRFTFNPKHWWESINE